MHAVIGPEDCSLLLDFAVARAESLRIADGVLGVEGRFAGMLRGEGAVVCWVEVPGGDFELEGQFEQGVDGRSEVATARNCERAVLISLLAG